MKTAVLDASSAILLYKAGLYQKLVDAYQLIIADSVHAELVKKGYPGAEIFAHSSIYRKIKVWQIQETKCNQFSHPDILSLHKGERDTVLCFCGGGGDFIITDDGRAARYCRNNNIPYINALLVPRILFFCQQLCAQLCQQTTQYLTAIGRYSPDIINFADNCTREDLEHFFPETDSPASVYVGG